uniref:Uncharacterized protein n=1 Tax=viral metagenome TaxID=1070528 RepID=A0A6C0CXV5_9ZZZZ
MNDRFKTDLLLYRNNLKEDDKATIKILNEELTNLKSQMKYVYEKDKKIFELKKQLNDYVKLVKEYSASKDKLTNDINDLKNENKKLLESISKLKKIIIKLETSSGNKNVVDIKKLIKQILLEKESKKIEDKMKDMDINEDNIDEVINNLN